MCGMSTGSAPSQWLVLSGFASSASMENSSAAARGGGGWEGGAHKGVEQGQAHGEGGGACVKWMLGAEGGIALGAELEAPYIGSPFPYQARS